MGSSSSKKVYVLSAESSAGAFVKPPSRLTVGARETLDMTVIVLPGVSADIPLTIDLTGLGAEVNLKGIYLSTGTDEVSFSITMNHLVGGCRSRQLFNGLASGSAKCSFFGKIIVAPDAQQTEAYQENHNIVLTDEASVNTKPQLEIYADDVKCSHGATVGKLNEDEQFYMRSRGIPEDEAKVLQMISFVAPVLNGLEDEALMARIESAIRSLAI
ncbi:MAG: SufD family Fe-S cluster assembly protein [Bacteroidales bacterium]|nr:SufD family Fe-S cluster assembly protein [Bacteroidales bacterium]